MNTTRRRLASRVGRLTMLVLTLGIMPPRVAVAQDAAVMIRGMVRTSAGAALAAAVVTVDGATSATTDGDGRYTIKVTPGAHTLRVTHQSYVPAAKNVSVTGPLDGVDFSVDLLSRFSEQVVVSAVRADADVPVTKKDIDRVEIDALNAGQEMPFLLKQVPSLTQYSDAGSATGYSYMYLRGIPQTRMNTSPTSAISPTRCRASRCSAASARRRWEPRRLSGRSTSPALISPRNRRPTSR